MAKVRAGSIRKRMTPTPLGKSILARRLAKGMKQCELGKVADVHYSIISRIESGHLRTVSFRAALGLAKALDCRPEDLNTVP